MKIPPYSHVVAVALFAIPTLAFAGGRNVPKAVEDSDFPNNGAVNPAKVSLGNFLFFDKILSGNRNISCATCHHPFASSSDGLSLPVGEGGLGLSVTRDTGTNDDAIHERVPRNSPELFNKGATEFGTFFHDGRLFVNPEEPSGFTTPAGEDTPLGLESILAAQALFPVQSATEMAGQAGENDIADAAAIGDLAGPNGVWALLAQRLQAIPEYVDLFKAAYPAEVSEASDITYVQAVNAIGEFEALAFRADNSPFDRYLRRKRSALSLEQKKGLVLFYNKRGGCYQCHSGKFQTDSGFHSIAMPQFGPGKGDGFAGRDDFGREKVTGDPADRYKFRTPSLRNVALTGPWGHAGAFNDLENVVRHHFDPVNSLEAWDSSQVVVPFRSDLEVVDFAVHNDPVTRAAIGASSDLEPNTKIREHHVGYLVEFMHALTDPASLDLRLSVPTSVPSGLPLYD